MKTEFCLKVPYNLNQKLPITSDLAFHKFSFLYKKEGTDFREMYGITYIDFHNSCSNVGPYLVYFSSLQKMMEFQLQYL
jgi:hypothetical protein